MLVCFNRAKVRNDNSLSIFFIFEQSPECFNLFIDHCFFCVLRRSVIDEFKDFVVYFLVLVAKVEEFPAVFEHIFLGFGFEA